MAYPSESLIVIWKWLSNEYQYFSNNNNDMIESIIFHPNGQFIIGVSLNSLNIWDIEMDTLSFSYQFDKKSNESQFNQIKLNITNDGNYIILLTDISIIIYSFYLPNNILNDTNLIQLNVIGYYQFIETKNQIISINSYQNDNQSFVTLTNQSLQIWNYSLCNKSDSNSITCKVCLILCYFRNITHTHNQTHSQTHNITYMYFYSVHAV